MNKRKQFIIGIFIALGAIVISITSIEGLQRKVGDFPQIEMEK